MTWNVANTDIAPISATDVKISLSTDGGLASPTALATNTPNNDGTESIVVPNVTTTTARVRIACAGNVFFDLSNAELQHHGCTGGRDAGQLAAEAQANQVLVTWETG